jgi:hypothetical protein
MRTGCVTIRTHLCWQGRGSVPYWTMGGTCERTADFVDFHGTRKRVNSLMNLWHRFGT